MDALTELLNSLPVRKPRTVKPKTTPTPEYCRQKYSQAHEQWFKTKHPQAYAAGHYYPPKMPDCNKSNGLQLAIQNFLTWRGHRATRISSAGRMVKGKWIPGPTRKGAADVSATIKGRSVMMEIKVGADRPSPEQLKEQQREQAAGGVYEFIHNFEEFLKLYDTL